MKNKKGQIVLTTGIIIALTIVAILIFGASLIAVFSNLPLLIGGAMLIITVIMGLKGDMTRTKGIFMTIFVLIGFILVFSSGITQSFNSSSQIWTVDSGRLECIEDTVETSIIKWVDQEYKFTCGTNALVDNCIIMGECGDTSFFNSKCDGAYKINNGGWITYSIDEFQNKQITSIKPGEKIEFATKAFTTSQGFGIPSNEDITKINYLYNPYRLYTIEAGAKLLSNSANCNLADQSELKRENIKYGEWDELQKGEIRNYFFGWVLKSGLKIYDYNNKEVICGFNSLYELEEERLSDGNTRKIQGSKIKSVECCPHQDDNCNANTFEFIPEPEKEERECDYSYQCANFGNIQGKTDELAVKESCVNGKCVEEEIQIECNSDNKCVSLYGGNYICDKTESNFGKCIIGSGGEICGNNFCGTGENFETCPSDCDRIVPQLSCSWYQEQKTVNQIDRPWYNSVSFGLIGSPTVTEVEQCRTSEWVYLVFGLVVVLGLGYLAISTKPKKIIRRKR